MATVSAQKRLSKEYKKLIESPVSLIDAHPEESNILNWHYVLTGPPDTAYFGGEYHGTVTFPRDYPYKPPAIKMITPSGRFYTNSRLCLSISDYHPETWNPSWGVGAILTGLLSFMTSNEEALGTVSNTIHQRLNLAKQSKDFNRRNPIFLREFPHLLQSDPKPEQKAKTVLDSKKKEIKCNVTTAALNVSAQTFQTQGKLRSSFMSPIPNQMMHQNLQDITHTQLAGSKRGFEEIIIDSDNADTLESNEMSSVECITLDDDDQWLRPQKKKIRQQTHEIIDLEESFGESNSLRKKNNCEPDVFIID